MADYKWETDGAHAIQLAIDVPLGVLLVTALAIHGLPLFGYSAYVVPAYLGGLALFVWMWSGTYKPWRKVVELMLFAPGAWLLAPWNDYPWWSVIAYLVVASSALTTISRMLRGGPTTA